MSSSVKIAVVFLALGGVVLFLLLGSSAGDAFVYSKLVPEVMAQPSDFVGRQLRVEGDLKQGSVKFREDPCEWRFVLEKGGKSMPVEFPQCVVPDTFRDGFGIQVTVQDTLASDGVFHATQLIPRCPSKYEMKQMQDNGQKMPHSLPQTSDRAPAIPPIPGHGA